MTTKVKEALMRCVRILMIETLVKRFNIKIIN